MPIGNQTSQFFANVYLSPFDHYIQEELGVSSYVRYVDDLPLQHLTAASRLPRLNFALELRQGASAPVR